jgi:hypothetical protein
MSKPAAGEKVDNAADDDRGDTIIAVFPTVDGNFRFFIESDGPGALKAFAEETLVVQPANLM